jgi:hypothetical protein
LGAQELEGAFHGDFDGGSEGTVWAVEFGVEGFVAGFFAEFVALPLEEFGSVCFLQEKEAETLDEGGEDGRGIETPSPRRVLRDESTGYGSDGWT